jgi:hypothetical protein
MAVGEDMTDMMVALPVRRGELKDGVDVSLEAVFSLMQRDARENFLREGELPAMFFLFSETEGRHTVTEIFCEWDSDKRKSLVLQAVRAMANEKDDHGNYLVKRFAFISEAYSSTKKEGRPSEDPNCIDVVNVAVKERGSPDVLYAIANVQHHALSPQPGLGEWDIVTGHTLMFDIFDDDAARTIQ